MSAASAKNMHTPHFNALWTSCAVQPEKVTQLIKIKRTASSGRVSVKCYSKAANNWVILRLIANMTARSNTKCDITIPECPKARAPFQSCLIAL